MVKGTILVKATKVQVGDSDDYYFEFQLNEYQTQQLIAELLVEHTSNGSLTIVHKKEGEISEKERNCLFLKSVLELYGDAMTSEMKNKYLDTILGISTV